MSITVFSADSTVLSGNAINVTGDNNNVLVTRDADIVATTGYGIYASGVSTITVLGNVAGDGSAVFMAASGGAQSLYVGRDAALTSSQTASGNVTVYASSGSKTVVNAGTIAGPAKIGVMMYGDDNTITNTGRIEAQSAVLLGYSHGLRATLFNSGVISANTFPGSSGDFLHAALYLDGADARITNAAGGIIETLAADGAALRLTSFANNSVVVNHGSMIAVSGATAINAAALNGVSERQHFTNTGLVQGDQNAYVGGGAMNYVTNKGHMIGNVSLGVGADKFDGRGGIVTGVVNGGLGDDQYLLSSEMTDISESGGDGIDTVSVSFSYELLTGFEKLILTGTADLRGTGNALDNRMSGNAGDNRLNGEAGNDTISGGAGVDKLLGWTGNDVLSGNSGDDTVFGGDGNDTLEGSDGDDFLQGGSGADMIYGAAGEDTLNGGWSADTMSGGGGEDVFIFAAAGHIGKLAGSRDTISDFAHGVDLIDLSRIDANTGQAGNQAFTFVGTGVLGGAAGKLQYVKATGLLSGDVNGDGVADFALFLSSKPVVTATDLML